MTTIQLYNTLSRTIEPLKPLSDQRVTVYTCGLTVYSQPHIGNWLGYIYWDVLVRTLKDAGYTVQRTQNITDVGHLVSDDDSGEDKMQKGARKEGTTAWDIAQKYSRIAEHEGYEMLGLQRPDNLVAATSCIDQQIAFAKTLDDKGYLYRTDDGMYFDTSKLHNYGALARLDAAGLEAGARVNMAGKKQPTDFAVWKFSPTNSTRDMEWDSPWGTGFPGWHLECSTIAQQTLGDSIDIHTGGIDHIPVHHTNEIAQTESLTGKPFATIWLHNNHIKVNGTKIAKSLGNGYTLDDIIARGFSLTAFKVMVLSKHYRTEGNFTWEILEAAQNRLRHWCETAALRWQLTPQGKGHTIYTADDAHAGENQIRAALQQDLDTPGALATIDAVLGHIEKAMSLDKPDVLTTFLDTVNTLLGINLASMTPDIDPESKELIRTREDARQQKDWARSDELRDELKLKGVGVEDTAHGTRWRWL